MRLSRPTGLLLTALTTLVVNLKAELEVQLLHEKLDHLLFTEWHKLLEIQAIQTEMLEELAGQADKKAR